MLKNSIVAKTCTLVAVAGLALFACRMWQRLRLTDLTGLTDQSRGHEPADLLTITIRSGVYSPNPLSVKVGQRVNWLNTDTFAHSATDPGVFDSGSIAPTSAANVPVLFTTPGTYNFQCTLHANETGAIVVTQ